MPTEPRSSEGRAGKAARTPAVSSPEGRAGKGRTPTVEETSAGGVIVDLEAEPQAVALIGRRDRRGRIAWSLPKGHLEAGETSAEAAVREVREETGIEGDILADLGTIDFWFMGASQRVHKTVHHFLLEATGGELSHDDIEVEESRWFTFDEAIARAAYPDEKALISAARQWLADHPRPGEAA